MVSAILIALPFTEEITIVDDEWSEVVDRVSLMKPKTAAFVPCSVNNAPTNQCMVSIKVKSSIVTETSVSCGLDLDSVLLTYVVN